MTSPGLLAGNAPAACVTLRTQWDTLEAHDARVPGGLVQAHDALPCHHHWVCVVFAISLNCYTLWSSALPLDVCSPTINIRVTVLWRQACTQKHLTLCLGGTRPETHPHWAMLGFVSGSGLHGGLRPGAVNAREAEKSRHRDVSGFQDADFALSVEASVAS